MFLVFNFNDKSITSMITMTDSNAKDEANLKPVDFKPDPNVKKQFDYIYQNGIWGGKDDKPVEENGGGSGEGSTAKYTVEARNILYEVIKKYKIKSMIDAPCGSMAWIPLLLKNITVEVNSEFKYFGVDVVESVINNSKAKYAKMYPQWQMSAFDFTTQDLPGNYDLIFSRDALQHLPLAKVVDALKMFARTKGTRYLLVGSYLESANPNQNTHIGGYFDIDVTRSPFNLVQFVETYIEKRDQHKKYLVLYDVKNYLSKIDFDLIKSKF